MIAPTIIQLGRTGDELNIFPVLRHIYFTTGIKPRVVVCREYLPLFERISYAEPIPFDGTVEECATALDMHHGAINCMMFGSSPLTKEKDPDLFSTKSWCKSQWYLLTHLHCWGKLPLIFDRRDEDAEARVCAFIGTVKRPYVVTFFGGLSSPAPPDCDIQWLKAIPLSVSIVPLFNDTRIPNFVDFLGLLEKAALLITSDSALLHLNRATKTPCIHFGRGGWESSGYVENVIFHCPWTEVEARRDEIKQHIEKALK